jgi:GrpB-like predicted nucleotidyltransferase (UPF0157 family)
MLEQMTPEQIAALQKMMEDSALLTSGDEDIKRQRIFSDALRTKALGNQSPGFMAGNVYVPQSGLSVVTQGLSGLLGGLQEKQAAEAAKTSAGKRGKMRGTFFEDWLRKPENVGGM